MLDTKSLIVLAYLKNYFKESNKPITSVEITIDGLNHNDIDDAIEILANNCYINLTEKNYIHPVVISIND